MSPEFPMHELLQDGRRAPHRVQGLAHVVKVYIFLSFSKCISLPSFDWWTALGARRGAVSTPSPCASARAASAPGPWAPSGLLVAEGQQRVLLDRGEFLLLLDQLDEQRVLAHHALAAVGKQRLANLRK